MHASIRRYIVSSSHEPEAIQRAQEEFGPMLRTVPGFVAYFFVDTGDGEMIGVSVFDSPEGAERANDLAREYVSAHLSNILQRTMLLEGDVVAYFQGEEPGSA
jgi:hypothetical protein